MNLRRIGRQLGIIHQTVANRVKEYAEKLHAVSVLEKVQTAKMDELFAFTGNKKIGPTSLRS